MTFRIQTQPRGFENLLGLYDTGRNPNELDEAVRATFDITPFYLANRFHHTDVSGNVQNPGDTLSIDIPSGEAWYMIGCAAHIATVSTGGKIQMSIEIRSSNTTGALQYNRVATMPQFNSAAAGSRPVIAFLFPMPLILEPGNGIQMILDESSLGAVQTGFLVAHYYLLNR